MDDIRRKRIGVLFLSVGIVPFDCDSICIDGMLGLFYY